MNNVERQLNRSAMAGVSARLRCRGFTITELLVSIGIIGMIAAITLPAVQQSRAASRRMQCVSNLRQIGIAAQNYVSTHDILPGYRDQAMFDLLPDLGHQDPSAVAKRDIKIAVLLCPDDTPPVGELGWGAVTNYLINGGACFSCYNGVHPRLLFPYVQPSRIADITDGTSHTSLFAERLFENTPGQTVDCAAHPELCVWHMNSTYTNGQEDQFLADCNNATERTSPWPMQVNVGRHVRNLASPYSHVVPPNFMSCYYSSAVFHNAVLPAKSNHSSGVNVVFCDGHAQFISSNIDVRVWRALGSRNGNDSTGEF